MSESGRLTSFPKSDIILNHKVFGEKFIPPKILFRDPYISQINLYLNTFIGTRESKPVIIWGMPGSGKTLIARALTQDIPEASNGILRAIYISVHSRRPTGIAEDIYEALTGEKKRTRSVTDLILELAKREVVKDPTVIFIDDFMSLDPFEREDVKRKRIKLLLSNYLDIIRAIADQLNIFPIFISNYRYLIDWIEKQRPDVARRVFILTIPTYSPKEMEAILRQRATLGLKPGSWDDYILQYIARTPQIGPGGDASQAIRLLYLAAMQASFDGAEKIEERHVDRARSQLAEMRLNVAFSSLGPKYLFLVWAIVRLYERNIPEDMTHSKDSRSLDYAPTLSEIREEYYNIMKVLPLQLRHQYAIRGKGIYLALDVLQERGITIRSGTVNPRVWLQDHYAIVKRTLMDHMAKHFGDNFFHGLEAYLI